MLSDVLSHFAGDETEVQDILVSFFFFQVAQFRNDGARLKTRLG